MNVRFSQAWGDLRQCILETSLYRISQARYEREIEVVAVKGWSRSESLFGIDR